MKKEFYISINGQKVPVSQEIYIVYYRLGRRMRYYEHDIKVGRLYKKTGREYYLPSREDSVDRLAEAGAEPGTHQNAVLDAVLARCEKEQLHSALAMLGREELTLLYQLYWNGLSERELSRRTGIPQKTLNDRKRRLLKRLRGMLEK